MEVAQEENKEEVQADVAEEAPKAPRVAGADSMQNVVSEEATEPEPK